MSNSSSPLLEVKKLKKYFKTPKGMLHAVDDVSFTIDRGRTLGVVGESGCGKSTTGRAILRIVEPTEGEILFDGEDIRSLGKDQMRRMRTRMQIIFQDPFSSLNPRKTVSETIAEPLKLNGIITDKGKRMERVAEIMEIVGLAERLYNAYPHELDGRAKTENWYCQGPGLKSTVYCLRRTSFRPGRFDPGTDFKSDG